jgi:diazepam-binding inhibitor (GABA receptor modulating acyl-CoA-binding protein)
MSDLKTIFEAAVADTKTLATRPSNDILLKFYGLYKQATSGDAPTGQSFGMFDFVNKAKHQAWESQAGLSSTDAMQQYVDLLAEVKSKA